MTGRLVRAWELVVDGFGRLEAPCFDHDGRLCFADIRAPGAVHRLEPDGHVTRLRDRSHVGGMVPHADGGVVATGSTVAVLADDGDDRVVMEHSVGLDGGWGFNDLATDRAGNVFVGMHGEVPTGGPPTVTASLCVTFGGDHYDSEHSGGVFRTRVGVAGAPVRPARV